MEQAPVTRRSLKKPLIAAAMLLIIVKAVEFAIDSQILFFYDSGAFIQNGMGLAVITPRSLSYGFLIRILAVPFHSLPVLVAIQMIMGAMSAWLVAFAAIRFFEVRPWIAIVAALIFAIDPVQVVYEHMVMAETVAELAMAMYVVMSLKYLREPSLWALAVLAGIGIVLVSFRFVYLPVVWTTAVLLPILRVPRIASLLGARPLTSQKRWPRFLATSLVVSCGFTLLFHMGYRHLVGHLAHREPAYQYASGSFLLSAVAPIVEPQDGNDPRIVAAIQAQNRSQYPLSLRRFRADQLWAADGIVNRLKTTFNRDEKRADDAAQAVAHAAIRRNPVGFVLLGLHNYYNYWSQFRYIRSILPEEHGSDLPPAVTSPDARLIQSLFGADVSNQHTLQTPSRRYHVFACGWYLLLLASPFLAALGWWISPASQKTGMFYLFCWSSLLLLATCFGGVESAYRYLHPLSFVALTAIAVLSEWAGRRLKWT